ncbi:hypothetical protein PWP93_36470 [Paraburkholderia sp. A1RI-2L]|uniref:hypothetical protein n=1 Tax=Paraburkholderia sp. A1RI-2L TaxID=3028367 RepID=UPI003B7ECCC9
MKNRIIRSVLCASAMSLAVVGTANAAAQLVCMGDGSIHLRDTVIISEPGQPGLVWVGMHNPDKTAAYLLNLQGGWDAYNGGLYSPAGRYDNGLPATMNLDVPLPPGASFGSTDAFVGWQVYEGHGVYTPLAQSQVALRRATLNALKPSRVAAGTWNPAYDSDDEIKWTLVQKDMTDNSKYADVLSIPYVNCTPPGSGSNH